MSQTRRLAVILAADVTGYSRLDEEGSPRLSMDERTCFAETGHCRASGLAVLIPCSANS
jgi:hypothetical protein